MDSLLARVEAVLAASRVPHAVIGAAAMAVHGVSRATQDIDVLVVSPGCLQPELWADIAAAGATVDIRTGDDDDPLAGVVRLRHPALGTVDVIVGKASWQRAILDASRVEQIAGASVPVASTAGLILLKLYAGGYQDRWDIAQLLHDAGASVADEVERGLADLPADARRLWDEIRRAIAPAAR